MDVTIKTGNMLLVYVDGKEQLYHARVINIYGDVSVQLKNVTADNPQVIEFKVYKPVAQKND